MTEEPNVQDPAIEKATAEICAAIEGLSPEEQRFVLQTAREFVDKAAAFEQRGV